MGASTKQDQELSCITGVVGLRNSVQGSCDFCVKELLETELEQRLHGRVGSSFSFVNVAKRSRRQDLKYKHARTKS